jgi:hypothetical protein
MSLHTFTIEEKLEVVEDAIKEARGFRAARRAGANRRYELLKSIAADLRGRQELPRNNTLGQLDRALRAAAASNSGHGYEVGKLIQVAETVISKWPTISQALEQFGEETAE